MTEDKRLLDLIPYPGYEQPKKQMTHQEYYAYLQNKGSLTPEEQQWEISYGDCIKKERRGRLISFLNQLRLLLFLNQLRLLLSASALFSAVLMIDAFSRGISNNMGLISTIIILFSGFIVGTVSIEDAWKIDWGRSKGTLVFIKSVSLAIAWGVGFIWGAVYILLILYYI